MTVQDVDVGILLVFGVHAYVGWVGAVISVALREEYTRREDIIGVQCVVQHVEESIEDMWSFIQIGSVKASFYYQEPRLLNHHCSISLSKWRYLEQKINTILDNQMRKAHPHT